MDQKPVSVIKKRHRHCRDAQKKVPAKKNRCIPVKAEAVAEVEDLPLDASSAREALLGWYTRCHRTLPWRQDPGSSFSKGDDVEGFVYRVWVSEVMLQQTQVIKVVEYYERWMQKYPTVHDLAAASLDDVREIWAGLGYYSRATNLLRGAQYLVEKLDGRFPSNIEQLQRIPGTASNALWFSDCVFVGVGPYTSRAIASIAFQSPEAVVDGNVVRVLARMFTVHGDPKKHQKLFQRLADRMLDRERPGDFNQAMMELGAVICRPQNPQCSTCPLQPYCKAFQISNTFTKDSDHLTTGPQVAMQLSVKIVCREIFCQVTDYPMVAKKAAKKEESVAVCVLQLVTDAESERSWYLMLKRPKTGLLAGLWQFPTVHLGVNSPSPPPVRQTAMDNYLSDISTVEILKTDRFERRSLGSVVHIFSHIRMTLYVETLKLTADPSQIPISQDVEHKWIPQEDMDQLGMCSMVKKVYMLFMKE